jgi:uncharacterized protein YdeI (YjbR/CyaY-like superfamily)
MNTKNPLVDAYIEKANTWKEEMKTLRTIFLDCQLTEELKWGAPCYTYRKSNIVIMREFKDCCVLILCKGSLLHDPESILIQPTENSQAGRQIRFSSVQDIIDKKDILESYMKEAIEVEKAGLKVTSPKTTELPYPVEFQSKLDENPTLKTAFESLTPGRQRAYYIYFSTAKQSKTREARVEKCIPQILNGKGLDD